jgi:alpha-methylacyl-CoA racemase
VLDGGAPFYELYETADQRHVAVAALEPQFYGELLERTGLTDRAPDRDDPKNLRALRELLTETFRQRTQAEWAELFEDSDACVTPVLPTSDAVEHPHLAARRTYVEVDGITQPAPAPRFSRTSPTLSMPPGGPGAHTRAALAAWGIPDSDALIESGAAVQA